jgi:hypothetical protein
VAYQQSVSTLYCTRGASPLLRTSVSLLRVAGAHTQPALIPIWVKAYEAYGLYERRVSASPLLRFSASLLSPLRFSASPHLRVAAISSPRRFYRFSASLLSLLRVASTASPRRIFGGDVACGATGSDSEQGRAEGLALPLARAWTGRQRRRCQGRLVYQYTTNCRRFSSFSSSVSLEAPGAS